MDAYIIKHVYTSSTSSAPLYVLLNAIGGEIANMVPTLNLPCCCHLYDCDLRSVTKKSKHTLRLIFKEIISICQSDRITYLYMS